MHLAEGSGDGAPAELPLAGSAAPARSGAPVTSGGPAAPGAAGSGAAASGAPAASGTPAASAPKFTSDPPDPTPLASAEQYEYSFRYEKGEVRLLGVRALRYKQPVVTARRIGRFAFELWIGRELIDRVRFDFPLLGGDELHTGPRPLGEPPSLASGSFDTKVLVPAAARARSARLVDRATRSTLELPWPPEPKTVTLAKAPGSRKPPLAAEKPAK
jgi:hypothetical protein